MVVVTDQVTKWWAWRHASLAQIDSGGGFVIRRSGAVYSDRFFGAALDTINALLLLTFATWWTSQRRPRTVFYAGCFVIAGWASDLLDRLGLHYWTAPGSARGVIDFLAIGDQLANLADLVITVASVTLFVATFVPWWRGRASLEWRMNLPAYRARLRAPLAGWPLPMPTRHALMVVVGVLGCVTTIGALRYGSVHINTATER